MTSRPLDTAKSERRFRVLGLITIRHTINRETQKPTFSCISPTKGAVTKHSPSAVMTWARRVLKDKNPKHLLNLRDWLYSDRDPLKALLKKS